MSLITINKPEDMVLRFTDVKVQRPEYNLEVILYDGISTMYKGMRCTNGFRDFYVDSSGSKVLFGIEYWSKI